LMPQGTEPPVVTDEVMTLRPPAWQRVSRQGRRGMRRAWALLARIPAQSLALVMLGVGLALFSLGLALYFWPATPRGPAVEALAEAPAAAASDAPAALPEAASQPAMVLDKPVVTAPAEPGDSAPPATALEPALPVVPGSQAASAPIAASAPAAPEVAEVAASQAELPQPKVPEGLPDRTYGNDSNGNGVPDVLDRWLSRTLHSQVTQEAARQYYRTVLPLATKLHHGIALSTSEKLSALRVAECYLITSADEGLRVPPNLNDRVLLQGGEPAERMKALYRQLQGVDYLVTGNRQQACG
jgi:hypothetical protein